MESDNQDTMKLIASIEVEDRWINHLAWTEWQSPQAGVCKHSSTSVLLQRIQSITRRLRISRMQYNGRLYCGTEDYTDTADTGTCACLYGTARNCSHSRSA